MNKAIYPILALVLLAPAVPAGAQRDQGLNLSIKNIAGGISWAAGSIKASEGAAGVPQINAASLAQAPQYTTSCRIENGEAIGSIRNLTRTRIRVRGKVWFFFYDEDGDLEDKWYERASESVGSRDEEDIETTRAPSNAVSCGFDVSEAVRSGGDGGGKLSTNCIITGDRDAAEGWVYNDGNDPITIAGDVTWRFYNSRGRETRTRSRYAYKYIPGRRRKLVKTYSSVPSSAVSCGFDVSDAI